MSKILILATSMALTAAQQVASVSMADPIGNPFMDDNQGDRAEQLILVAVACVIAIGVVAANFINWRRDLVETCDTLNDKDCHKLRPGRGSAAREGHGSGISAGSCDPLHGTDSHLRWRHGIGLSSYDRSGNSIRAVTSTTVAYGDNGSSML